MDDQHPLTEDIIDDIKCRVRDVFDLHGEEAQSMCMRLAADWQVVLCLLALKEILDDLRTYGRINEAMQTVLTGTFTDRLRPEPQQQENS